jgi:response regulator of citrate/malate metabolism
MRKRGLWKFSKLRNAIVGIVSGAFDDEAYVLVGEAKHSASGKELDRLLADLKSKAQRCPEFKGKNIYCALWIMKGIKAREKVFTADEVVEALK